MNPSRLAFNSVVVLNYPLGFEISFAFDIGLNIVIVSVELLERFHLSFANISQNELNATLFSFQPSSIITINSFLIVFFSFSTKFFNYEALLYQGNRALRAIVEL